MCNHMDNFVDFETIKRTSKNSTVKNWLEYQNTDALRAIASFGLVAIAFTFLICIAGV